MTRQLINFLDQKPFFTYINEGLNIEAYYAQSLYLKERYLARNAQYFEKGDSAVLYLITHMNGKHNELIFNIPKFDRRFVKNWTKEEWTKVAYLLHRQSKIGEDLAEVEEAMTTMGYFSEMRKAAKERRKQLIREKKVVAQDLTQFLAEIREKGYLKIVSED